MLAETASSWALRVEEVAEQLAAARTRRTLTIGRHRLSVTNLDKPLWPRARPRPVTKRDLLVYLTRVAPHLLFHLDGRPVFVTRAPNGVEGTSFFQKSWDDPPEFVRTITIWSRENRGAKDYLLVADLPTLLWLGQQAALELHVWFSRIVRSFDGAGLGTGYGTSERSLTASRLNYPDFLVIDLDSYLYSGREPEGEEPELHREGFARVRDVAFEVRETALSLGLEPFVKTSGRTGLHLYLPILRDFTFDEVRAIARTLGEFLRARHPDRITLEWAVRDRTGHVFFDYNQNVRGKSLAAPLSPRLHPAGTVSMPLSWDELATAYPTDFTIHTAADWLERHGDPWAGILEAKADLEAALGPVAGAGGP